MLIEQLKVGIISTNCYIVSSCKNNCVIIDPGDNALELLSFINGKGLTLKKILLTHGHFDHIGAVSELVKQTQAEVYIHKNDAVMLSDSRASLADMIPGFLHTDVKKFSTVVEKDVINLDELSFKVMHTPGHTQGSVVYIVENCIFSGDTLFCGEVGRTDFPGGSYESIIDSVKRIAALEGDYKVYPGHDECTTLENERKNNMYIKG